MKWLRSNIKHGSRLALFALAVQFVLSFGHFHAVDAQAAPAIQSALALSDRPDAGGIPAPAAVDGSAQQQPIPHHDSDQPSSDPCAICAVANAALFATPPLLLLPQAIEFLYLATAAELVHLSSARAAFQPRAPPLS
jgi:hypothetical protein